jgi:hypothetical protein
MLSEAQKHFSSEPFRPDGINSEELLRLPYTAQRVASHGH